MNQHIRQGCVLESDFAIPTLLIAADFIFGSRIFFRKKTKKTLVLLKANSTKLHDKMVKV